MTDLPAYLNPPSKRAELLIVAAELHAGSVLPSLLERYPELDSVLKSDLLSYWDFLLTIACGGRVRRYRRRRACG